MNNRVACIRIVDFPLIVLVQDRAALSLSPYAVAEHDQPNAVLVAVNRVAECDVRVGMTVAQARNRCAQLRVLAQDSLREQRAAETIQELLYGIGPNIEIAALDEYYLELRGLTRLYGGEDGIARSILRQFASSPFTVQVGVAGNKPVARIAAYHACPNGTLNIRRGSERSFLAPLPIAALGIVPETNSQLYALGLKTIGDLTRLPLQEITRRFGEDVRCLAECMRSDGTAPVTPLGFPQIHTAEICFDDALDNTGQLIENIMRLLQGLLAPLLSSGQGCREIAIQLEGGYLQPKLLPVKLNQFAASLPAWRRQVQHVLSDVECAFGITTIRVALTNIGTLPAGQLSLFSPINVADYSAQSNNAEAEKLPLTRIALTQKVLPEDGCIHSAWGDPGLSTTEYLHKTPQCFYAGSSLAGLRLLQHPHGVRVTTTNGNICGIVNGSGVERVVRQCAPFNVSGGWWEREYRRSYYEVETDLGMSYLLFCDELRSQWYVQGHFD